jgi:membrane protein
MAVEAHKQAVPQDPKDHTVGATDPLRQRIWDHVNHSPLHNLWDFQGVAPFAVAKRTFNSFNDDNLVSRAAELGYYFLFALFPTLLTASAIFGLVVRNGDLYLRLLNYLRLVVPPDAFKMVLETFNQTTAAASGGKLVFGLAAGLWSASVGFSAIQDTLNIVYKVKETRPYWKVKGAAILVTVLLSVIVLLTLAALAAGTFLSHWLRAHLAQGYGLAAGVATHLIFDVISAACLVLLFAVIYYFAPDVQNKVWRWFTPGAAIGILGWFLASLALRIYLAHSNSYSLTYGSLGAVIILLTWFYITGLMLLLGAEVNSEIESAVAECKLKAAGAIPEHATTDARAPIS